MAEVSKMSVFDPRIVQEKPAFAVDKGALSLTNAPFKAIASTSSQMTFNIQVPSLNVFIDREMEWTTGVRVGFTTTIGGAPIAIPAQPQPVVVFGKDVALCPFPLHSLVSTMTATINDAVATINTQDILYEILRLTDLKANRLERTTPTMLDKYLSYDDAVGAINNPLASYFDGTDYDNIPNGAFWDIQFTDATGAPLVGNGTYNDGANVIDFNNGVPILTDDGGGVNVFTSYRIFVVFTATEKLVLSPFIFSEEHGDEVGLYGVNNIQLVFNFRPATRVIRNATLASGTTNTRTISNVALATSTPFVDPTMNIQFLTPSLDIALPPRNVLPYLEYARYIQTIGSLPANSSGTYASSTITLPQIPDMLLIYAKPYGASAYSSTQGDYYFPIDQISVNFDNFAGLLSSHTSRQLYRMSVQNGLKMDWNTWNGSGRVVNNATSPLIGTASANNVNLVGGMLVLKMGKDITLQAGQAPSVVGNYTLQFNYRVLNKQNVARDAQLYVVAVNSGFFETQSGSSRIVKGVLTEQDVISAPVAPMASRSSLERYVGGGFFSKLGTALNKAKEMMKNPAVRNVVKGVARSVGGEKVKGAVDFAERLGFGATGGGRTGGGRTGGRKGSKARLDALM